MGMFSDLFKAGPAETIKQEAMLTDEQKRAMEMLQGFGATGSLAGMGKYQGALGNFDMSALERSAIDRTQGMLDAGTPQALKDSQGFLRGIAEQGFDAESPLFQSFKKAALRQVGDASDILNRESAITGSRYGTNIGREKGLLAERTNDVITSRLAQLFDTAQNRSLQAAGALGDTAGLEQSILGQQLGLAGQFGGLERLLKNAEAQANLAQFDKEQSNRLGALSTVFNKNVPYGMKELTVPGQAGPFSGLLNTALSAGGAALGNMIVPGIGGMIGGQLGGMLGGEITGTSGGGGGGGMDLMGMLGGSMGGSMFGGGRGSTGAGF